MIDPIFDRLRIPPQYRATATALTAIAGIILLLSAIALLSEDEQPRQAVDDGPYESVEITPADELLRGGRKEWLAADSKTQLAAIEKLLRKTHPELTENDLNFDTGFLCGRIDLIYEQQNIEQLAKTLDSINRDKTWIPPTPTQSVPISADARELLLAAATNDGGEVLVAESLRSGGRSLSAGTRDFVGTSTGAREAARWQAALDELLRLQLVDHPKFTSNYYGSASFMHYRVTTAGFELGDRLKAK